ncbi:MAG: TonB-dependent receptor [Bacteroidales bacterium]|nr:TonB-dependent receptor [Bacteroidales bacterium]
MSKSSHLRILRATLVLFALLVPLFLSAQNVTLDVKGATVQQAVTLLQSQGNYTIVINADDVDLQKRVTVSAKDAPLTEVLAQIFAGQNLEFSVSGNTVSVNRPKSQPAPVSATLKGVVVDGNGETVIGASVVDKASGKYAITNEDGEFVIGKLTFPAVLTVSYLGFNDQIVTFTGHESQPVRIVLTSENTVLEELVVVGYGTQKRVNLTGAVSVIDGKDLNFRPVTNTAMAIQGADPSLVITNSSGSIDGTNYSINIRGKVSLNSGSPLVLVDGIEGHLSQVNPNDIESISVLKDASACAIYGAKASAGVVLITTKSGNAGDAKITYNGRFSVSTNTTSTDFMTCGYDYVTLTNDFYKTFKGYGAWTYSDEQLQMLYERRNDVTENPARPWVIPDETGTYTYVYLGNFDWYNFVFNRTRPETEHNVTVRGGTDKARYYGSARYLYRKGLFAGEAQDIFNSLSLRGKVDANLTSWLTYSSNISLERSRYDWGGFWEMDGSTGYVSQGIMFNVTQNVGPNYVPYNPDGTIAMVPGFMADATSPLMSGRGGVFMDGRNHNSNVNNYWTWTNRLTAHIIKGLDFTADYTYRRRDRNANFRSLPTANSYDNINKRMYSGNGLSGGLFSNGSVYDFTREYRYYQDGNVVNAYFSYNQNFGDHHVAATLGGNYDDYYGSSVTIQQKGSLSDALSYINMANGEIEKASQGISAYRTLGFFGRVNYDWKGRYLVEMSGRYDGSSRFPKDHRWGFFPSASAGWRISEEPFWTPVKPYVSNAKIRLSYGTLGNQQVDNYYYWETIKTGLLSGYTFDGLNNAGYAYVDAPVSSGLTWETVISKNLGIDLGFLQDRLTLNADFFIRDTKNMLTAGMSLPYVYGEAAPKENAADLRTKGYELALSWKDHPVVAGKPMFYGVTVTLGDFVTDITRFNNPTYLLSDNYVGKRLGDIWGYVTDGLFASDEEAAAYEASITSFDTANKSIKAQVAPWNHLMAGDIKYVDLNGDGKINTGANTLDNPGDRRVIGNSRPRYNYALKGDFSWYGFDLSVFFQGVGKLDWMPNANCIYFWGPYSYHRPTFVPKDFAQKCWSAEPGADNSNAVFPRQRGRIAASSYLVTSDYYLQNAAYLRLKNLTIGYTIPIKNKVLEKARVYFSGENLFYLSPLKKATKYVDPEVATSSISDDCTYPYSKTFSIGIDVTF